MKIKTKKNEMFGIEKRSPAYITFDKNARPRAKKVIEEPIEEVEEIVEEIPEIPEPPMKVDFTEVITIITEQNELLKKFVEKEEKPIEVVVNLEIT